MPGRNARYDGFNRMYLVVNAAPHWGGEGDATRGSFLRCTRDAQPVELRIQRSTSNSGWTTTDEVDVHNSAEASLAEWIYPNPNGDNPRALTERFLFRQYVLELPLTFTANQMFIMRARGTETNRAHEYDRNITMTPGAWECQWRNEARDTVRVFRWTVGANGLPMAHPEQARLSLGPGAFLIETVVPEGNALDARTDPAAIVGDAFNGHGFTSDGGRQQARAVPAIGIPHPTETTRGGPAKAPPRRRGR
ncbi:MAG: hypothetical protein HYY06_10620 [Deltaproteobacteria bacterium]|nr:hypothetical protein [Deltaproteobacteria bacterium]